jgi:AcrR family transcriptional regulator
MNELNTLEARSPLQQRGQARVDAVLTAAHGLLADEGLSAFSIPALAKRLGFTRMSIYHFFPTSAAILNELTRRALDGMEQRVVAQAMLHPKRRWDDQIVALVRVAIEYFKENPVAQLVVLGNGLTAEGLKAQSVTVLHLGNVTSRLFEATGYSLPRVPIDTPALLIDLGMTCLRMSVQLHGRITPEFEREATDVMIRYLEPHIKEQQSERI